MKKYIVWVYRWPENGQTSELWLGYTRSQGEHGKSFISKFNVDAETRGRAITKAIAAAKTLRKLRNEENRDG